MDNDIEKIRKEYKELKELIGPYDDDFQYTGDYDWTEKVKAKFKVLDKLIGD